MAKKKAKSRKKTVKSKTKKKKVVAPKATGSGANATLLVKTLRSLGDCMEQVDRKIDLLVSNIGVQTSNTPKVNDVVTDLFDTVPGGNGEAVVTLEDVTQGLQEVLAKHGQPALKKILKAHKAAKLSEIDESQWAKVLASCKEVDNTASSIGNFL